MWGSNIFPIIKNNEITYNTAGTLGGGILLCSDSDLLPDTARLDCWGTGGENIPIGEASELVEIFQWVTPKQSRNIAKAAEEMKAIEEEVADVFIYLIRLCDKLNIDLEKVVNEKMRINGEKYPISTSKGVAVKYNKKLNLIISNNHKILN